MVINGPRFSTRAESAWYVAGGADIISMTQYPEPVLAAELNMGFANLAYITDSDTGHDGSEPVTAHAVFARLKHAQDNVLAILETAVAAISADYAARPLPDPEAVRRIMALPPVVPSAGLRLRLLVTGGAGFIGSHIVEAARQGMECSGPRLLGRCPAPPQTGF